MEFGVTYYVFAMRFAQYDAATRTYAMGLKTRGENAAVTKVCNGFTVRPN